jgi:hypothetical protein
MADIGISVVAVGELLLELSGMWILMLMKCVRSEVTGGIGTVFVGAGFRMG